MWDTPQAVQRSGGPALADRHLGHVDAGPEVGGSTAQHQGGRRVDDIERTALEPNADQVDLLVPCFEGQDAARSLGKPEGAASVAQANVRLWEQDGSGKVSLVWTNAQEAMLAV